MKQNLWKEFTKGIIKENPVLIQLLGCCPTLAVTTSAVNGLGMGVSTMAVLICSNIVISILKKKEIWISGVIGLVLGAAIICLLSILGVPGLGNETIAKYKGGKVTENSLYKEMQKSDKSDEYGLYKNDGTCLKEDNR